MEYHRFSLEDFAPELRLQITFQLDSLKTLHNLILASASFYQVFASQKEQILLHFVRQLIAPEVLPDAVAAVNAARLPPDADKLAIIDFLRRLWKDERVQYNEPSLPFDILVDLCRLHKSVEFHMSGITDKAFTAMENYAHAVGSAVQLEASATPLSFTETTRLQRALYRFQLYCNLFYTPTIECSKLSAAEQSRYFLDKFQAWQIEEIACVHDYLLAILEGIFDQVEDKFVDDLRETVLSSEQRLHKLLAAEIRSRDKTKGNAAEASLCEEGDNDDDSNSSAFSFCASSEFDHSFYSHGTKSNRHEYYMKYMLSLGLNFLRNLCHASVDTLQRLVTINAKIGGDFFSDAIEFTRLPNVGFPEVGKSMDNDDQENNRTVHFRGDRGDEPNDAWLWSFEYERGTYIPTTYTCRFHRTWCYTFWDSQRLKAYGILRFTLGTLMEESGYEEGGFRDLEPSAEDRLKLVKAGQSGNRVESGAASPSLSHTVRASS